MKRVKRNRLKLFIVIGLIVVVAFAVWAKTNYFENIVVDGTSTLTGNATLSGTLAVTGTSTLTGVTTLGAAGNIIVTDATNSGAMFISQFSVTYAQTASYTVCVIPANADVVKVEVATTTAFAGGSGTTIDIGYTGTLEAYASDLDVRSAGFAACDVFSNLGDVGATDVTMKAQIATDDTSGACTVYIYWTMGTPDTP